MKTHDVMKVSILLPIGVTVEEARQKLALTVVGWKEMNYPYEYNITNDPVVVRGEVPALSIDGSGWRYTFYMIREVEAG
jgi:hypothetical protein